MDQLSAHLDRGWDLAQRGDAPGATACAKRALEIDPQSPEVHNLLGYTAALNGDADEALEHYRQAIALDDTYFEAMLNASEVLLHPLGEWEEAISMCEDAHELAETAEEQADCLLLKVEALIALGRSDDALKTMSLIPDKPFENPSYTFLIGRSYYELGRLEKAAPYIEDAARRDALSADAQYYLGLVRDERGDARGATEALLRSRGIDAQRLPPTWSPSPDTFASMVRGVLSRLDVALARYVRGADVFVVDLPGPEIVVEASTRARSCSSSRPLPPKKAARGPLRLFVYQRNVERVAGSLEAMEEETAGALEREIASFFLERETGPDPRLN
ncbi:MAG: tetratricopeptide repeat protein [Polyangiaceae bacterium]